MQKCVQLVKIIISRISLPQIQLDFQVPDRLHSPDLEAPTQVNTNITQETESSPVLRCYKISKLNRFKQIIRGRAGKKYPNRGATSTYYEKSEQLLVLT